MAACIYILHMELVIFVPTDAQDEMVLDHLLIASVIEYYNLKSIFSNQMAFCEMADGILQNLAMLSVC